MAPPTPEQITAVVERLKALIEFVSISPPIPTQLSPIPLSSTLSIEIPN